MKKIAILSFLFIAPVLIYLSCCKCSSINTSNLYKNITGLTISAYGQGGSFAPDTIFVRDSLVSLLNFKYDFVAKNQWSNINLMNEASATSCNCEFYPSKGIKSKIDSLVIVSDQIFNGLAPNSNLAHFFVSQFSGQNNFPQYGTVAQSIDSSLNGEFKPGFLGGGTTRYYVSKPFDNLSHRITFILYYNNLQFRASERRVIKWL